MQESLRELRTLGVQWVAVHPYAGVRRDGSVRLHPTAETPFLDRAAAFATAEGIDLFWKPHLAYWGSFSWRGAIQFRSETEWERFFAGYREFLLDQARFAERHGLPLLAVGTELDATLHHETAWRALIAEVRSVYSGRLTYAANWDAYHRVPFWDALDLIGIQAYFPLAEEGAEVTVESIDAAWDIRLDALRTFSRRLDRPILFTEIGYARSSHAASQPWLPAMDSSAQTLQARRVLLDAALRHLRPQNGIAGAFWWKWMPGEELRGHDGDFSMRDPEARAALRGSWGQLDRASQRPGPQSVTPPTQD